MGNYRPTSVTTWLCCVVLLYLTIQIAEVSSSSTTSSSVSTQQPGSSSAPTPAPTTAPTAAPTAAPTPAPTPAPTTTEKQSSKSTTTTSQATTVTTTSTQSTVATSTGTTTTTEAPALGVTCANKSDNWCNTAVSGAVECREDTCQCLSGHFQSNLTTCTPDIALVPINPVTTNVTTSSFGISWSQNDSLKDLALNLNVAAKRAYAGDTIPEVSCTVTSGTTASCSGLESGYKYNVTVTVTYNVIHTGHNVKQESTYPNPPGALNDTSSSFTAPDVTLVWTGSTGRVDIYSVEVRQSDGSGQVQNESTSSDTPEIVIRALEAGRRYNVTITANSYSKQSQQRMDTFRTVSEEPGPPKVVTVTSVTSTSIKIRWSETDQPNGDILAHQVCVRYKVYIDDSYNDLICKNTTTGTLEYEIDSLYAGTFYQFDVYTVNDVSVSSNASVYQRTNSTVPAQVSGLNGQSMDTSIGVTWSRPSRPNGDIITYSVYWSAVTNNRNCTVYLTSVESTDINNSCYHNITAPESITVNQVNLTYTIINLEPHTMYIIRVTAYTSEGAGAIATINKQTSVAVPDPVTNVMADPLNATAVNVSWTIPTVNPGPVRYTVTANNMVDNAGSTQSCTVEGYNMSYCKVSGLEEYWMYSFSVVASTDAGTSMPSVSDNVTTAEAEPGPVSSSSYQLYNTTDCDATKVKIMWEEPSLHDRNSRIIKYMLSYSPSLSHELVVYKPEPYRPDNRQFDVDISNLKPEFTYKVEIWAVSTSELQGHRSSISLTTGVCAPPDWADSDLQAVTEARSTTTSLTIVLPPSFFEKSRQGQVREKGLIILPTESNYYTDTTGMSHTDLKDWPNSQSYQFVKDYKIMIKVDAGEEFTIGQETECSKADNGYNFCNGPLPEQFSFKVAAYVCTQRSGTALCTISKPFGPFATQATPAPSESSGSTLAIVLSIVFVLMICVLAFALLWYKDIIDPKSWFAKKDSDDDDDDYFTPLDKMDKTKPIKIWRYSAELEEMHRDTNLILSDQYDDINKIGQMVAESSTTDASKLESNTPKNRWVNILPFDHSRVKLQQIDDDDPTSDYINANYMPGFNNKREYIATQGPLPGTTDDFWRMVWEHDVKVIVMLTQCKEGNRVKCEKYWPDELREPKQYGEVVVNPISISQLDKYNISIFDVSVNGESRQVIHFHYLDFPDFSANVEFDHFINFVRTVRNHVPHDMTGPMVIHCSAGVGRTGTFIATDRLNLYLNSPKFNENDDVDIFGIVVSMRENRVAMVQTESQYIMIHDCFVKMLEDKRKAMQVTDSTENLYENQGFDATRPGSHPYPEVLYENVTTTAQQQTEL